MSKHRGDLGNLLLLFLGVIIIFTSIIITGCTEKESGYSVSVVFADMTFQQYDNVESHIIIKEESIGKTVDLHFADGHVERLHYVTSIEKIYSNIMEAYNEYMSKYTQDIDSLNSIEKSFNSLKINNPYRLKEERKAFAIQYIEEAEYILPRLEELKKFIINNEQELIKADIDTKNVKNKLSTDILKIEKNIEKYNDFIDGHFIIV